MLGVILMLNNMVYRLFFIVILVLSCYICSFIKVYAFDRKIGEYERLDISVEELISRIHVASTIEVKNAVGYYIQRDYSHKSEEKIKYEIERFRQGSKETLKLRIENDKKFGVVTDVKKLEKESEDSLAEYISQLKKEIYTFVVRYTVEGKKYRIERVNVSNTDSLTKIKEDVLASRIDLSSPNVIVWNGESTAEIVAVKIPYVSNENDTASTKNIEKYELRSSIRGEQYAKIPEFVDYSRELKDLKVFSSFNLLNMPFNAMVVQLGETKTHMLRIGKADTIGTKVEIYALPDKGYAITLGRTTLGGVVRAEESYRNFVKTNDGSWLPMSVIRNNYGINKQGVPYLVTKRELLAIEPPKVNVELPVNVFDLINTKEFQSIKPLFITTPKSAEGGIKLQRSSSFVIRLFCVVLGIIFFVLGLFLRIRYSNKHNIDTGIILASVCCLLLISGCSPALSNKADIVLTDSTAIVNNVSGIVQIVSHEGMGVEKTLTIKSQRKNKIDKMYTTNTCDCVTVKLGSTNLEPDQNTTISFYFKPESTRFQNKKDVNIFIRTETNQRLVYVIPITYSNYGVDHDVDSLKIRSIPEHITFDVIKTDELSINKMVYVQFDKPMISKGLEIITSSPHVVASLENIKNDTQNVVLNVNIKAPPIGNFEESIQLRFSRNNYTFCKEIRVFGRILSPFFCKPVSVCVTSDDIEGGHTVDIDLFRRDNGLEYPSAVINGDWELRDRIIGENKVTFRVIPTRKSNKLTVVYGNIKFQDLHGNVVATVPLIATY
jgi:hypothetical protein